MLRAALLSILVLAAAPALAEEAAPAASAAKQDWAALVAATAEGGYRIGNPDAKVKLVEYGSLGCSHCAHFAAEADGPLRSNYIAGGQVSFEFRPFLIFPTDLAASQLLGCTGATGYFPALEKLFAAQKGAHDRLEALPRAEQERIEALDPAAQGPALIKAMGFDTLFRAQGLSDAQQSACLADQAAAQRLGEVTDAGVALGVTGTPAFLINGKLVEDAPTWQALETRLKGAIGA
ncbi:MAG TPA: thioredoxin domain-containing protein [Allosphingosinicella sp.]|jgi:protein-disulfide isomerase